METLKERLSQIIVFFLFYYTLSTLLWLPFSAAVSWKSFVTSDAMYIISGIISFALTFDWVYNKKNK